MTVAELIRALSALPPQIRDKAEVMYGAPGSPPEPIASVNPARRRGVRADPFILLSPTPPD